MSKQSMMKKLGLTPADFEPKQNDDSQRIKDIEDAIIELAEMLAEGEETND